MQNVSPVFNIIFMVSVGGFMLLGVFFVMRWYYSRIPEPSKKAPYGRIMAVWVSATGKRTSKIVPVIPAGPGSNEVRGPDYLKNSPDYAPRYFYDKSSTQRTWWPDMMPFKALQVPIDLVEWPENCPEPMSFHGNRDHLTSSDYLGSIENKGFFQLLSNVTQEMLERFDALAKAALNMPNKTIWYIMSGIGIAVGAASAVIAYQTMEKLKDLMKAWGM